MMHRLISAHVAAVGSDILVMVLEEGTSSMSLGVGTGGRGGVAERSDESVAHPSASQEAAGHPTTPFRTILSTVSVPVLSKHSTSSFPANGIRNGSVQNTSPLLKAARELVTVQGMEEKRWNSKYGRDRDRERERDRQTERGERDRERDRQTERGERDRQTERGERERERERKFLTAPQKGNR
jgi:hypothetical protein